MVDFLIKKVDYILAALFCLTLFPGMLGAQPDVEDYMVIDRLSRENGLPDQDINGIYFDSMGYLWISTFGGGLVRYDGDSFIKFSSKTDPSFFGDYVNQCCEDAFGRLWIPCAGGMSILDIKTLAFTEDFSGMPAEWRRSHSPRDVTRDTKGCMWFTSDDKLFRVAFADDGNRFVIDSLQCNVTNYNLMPSTCDVDNDGSAWITLDGHIYKVRHMEDSGLCMSEILPGVDIGDDNKATAYLRSGNDVWIGTLKGLYKINISSGNYICYLHSESDRHSLPNDEITGLCFSPEGDIVIGTLGGISIYNSTYHSFDTYRSRPNDYGNTILPGEMVRCIATRNKQIWVGLEAEGLAVMQRKPLQVINISHIESSPSPISPTPVRSMFIDSDGVLWLAATEYGLYRQVGDLTFRNYSTDNSALSDNSVTCFCEDGQRRIWAGTVTGHLHYISMSTPGVIHRPDGYESETARSIDVIIGLVYDSINDYVWIMTRSGLYYYDIAGRSYEKYPGIVSSCLGACIVSDRLWVSNLEGMNIIDLKTLECRTLADFPYCMALLPDGETLWAGTSGKGVYKVENSSSDKPDITVFSENDALEDNQINGLLLDGTYLWITTENGLFRLDTQIGEITGYGTKDGLGSMAFCENSISKGSDGTIYLGLKNGLSILRYSYVPNEYVNKPEVVISGYYIKDVFHSLSLYDTISKGEGDRDFVLKFSDLSYFTGSDIIYESRILPLDKEWTPVFENDRHVKFGHIPGGKYKVQIRAIDRKGNVLSQDEKSLDVKPFVYNRWWFRLLALLLFALIVYMLVLWKIRSVNRTKDLLRQEVDRQTRILNVQKEELERKAAELAEQNALLQKQNEMIASHNTLFSGALSSMESDFTSDLLETIQKKYKDPALDVAALADAMGMSRTILNEKIQKTLGQSIVQFIRTYRLNVAKEMICNGTNKDMNISEIAYEVGFNDPKYFTRCFTKEFGATPSDLHKENRDQAL